MIRPRLWFGWLGANGWAYDFRLCGNRDEAHVSFLFWFIRVRWRKLRYHRKAKYIEMGRAAIVEAEEPQDRATR